MALASEARRPTAEADAAAPMVELRGVSKRFGTSVAVDRVGFALGRGRFLTILGPSGSGKTTLLRMIAGFIAPDEGEIVIHGRPISDVPPYRRSIGMVFQRLALFPHMTAAQNVAYPLKMRRFDPRTIPGEVERYLELVRLGGLGGRRIQELSGGQQQRVAIARALVFRPDLLLLDEPLASLDRRLREDMQLELRRIQRELGVTTINVTHDQREALVMSDEVLVMSEGRLQQHASPEATYRAPANRFVAGFIGVTNFLAGRVVAVGAQRLRLRVGGAELVGARPVTAPEPGAELACAVRAEQVRIGADAAAVAGLDNALRARVLEAIFEGDRTVYTVAPEALPDVRLRVFDHDPLHERTAPVGAVVHVGWNAHDLMVFD
ncbi:MAG TPA: ABC transporter ATP-binding protein [Geminicoccaceae bacterium]|nr:ABC transporter ATP-binding protein [Geminicoccaceae bacterium]